PTRTAQPRDVVPGIGTLRYHGSSMLHLPRGKQSASPASPSATETIGGNHTTAWIWRTSRFAPTRNLVTAVDRHPTRLRRIAMTTVRGSGRTRDRTAGCLRAL